MKSENTGEGEMESGREGGKRIQLFGKKPNRKLRLKEIDVEESEFENSSMKPEKTFFAGLPERKVQKKEFNLLLQHQQKRQQQHQQKRQQQQQKEGKLVDVRIIHESVGRDLICNSCQHHVPTSLKHSILCRKYEGPLGTQLYRCFTSCPNCFVEWKLWPNNRYADSFDVLSGATYQEIIPEPNLNTGQM